MSIYPGAAEGVIEVDGESVAFVDAAKPGVTGRPVVLVHGSGGTAAGHFGALLPMLAGRRRVVAFDYGRGAEDTRGPLSLDQIVAKIRGVVDHCVPKGPVDLVGYSLGSLACVAYAVAAPTRCASLVMIAGWLRTDGQQQIRGRVWRSLFERDSTQLANYSILMGYGANYLAKLPASDLDALVDRWEPGPDRERQMSLIVDLDITDDAARLATKTLLIGGLRDQVAPMHHQYQLLGAIDDARLALVETGHAMLAERPAELHQLIDSFTQNPDSWPVGQVTEPMDV